MKYIKLFNNQSDLKTAKDSIDGPCLFMFDKKHGKPAKEKKQKVRVVNEVKKEEVKATKKQQAIPRISTSNEGKLVAKFNITDISAPIKVLSSVDSFKEVEIDGVVQDLIQTGYTFESPGIHIVKYTPVVKNEIGNEAFAGVSDMISISFSKDITKINYKAFMNCDGLVSFDVPEGVTNIGNSAFYGCKKLTAVTLSDSVNSIGPEVFNSCPNLLTVTLSKGMVSIPGFTFYGCAKLPTIRIPNGIVSIGQGAFRGCKSMKSIVCSAMKAPSLTKTAFQSIKANGVLYVPKGSEGYDTWMSEGDYYLGKYGWLKLEK